MHIKFLVLLFLQPDSFAYRAFKNFFDNTIDADHDKSVSDSTAFMVWSHIYVYILLYFYRLDDEDNMISSIAVSSQSPFFTEFFAFCVTLMMLVLFYISSLIITKRGSQSITVSSLISCYSINQSLWIIYVSIALLLKSNQNIELGYEGDVANVSYYGLIMSIPALASWYFTLNALSTRRVLNFPPLIAFVISGGAISYFLFMYGDTVSSSFLVYWHDRESWFEIIDRLYEAFGLNFIQWFEVLFLR